MAEQAGPNTVNKSCSFHSAVGVTALDYWLSRTASDVLIAYVVTESPSIIDGNHIQPVESLAAVSETVSLTLFPDLPSDFCSL